MQKKIYGRNPHEVIGELTGKKPNIYICCDIYKIFSELLFCMIEENKKK
jgi:hypothetical protein